MSRWLSSISRVASALSSLLGSLRQTPDLMRRNRARKFRGVYSQFGRIALLEDRVLLSASVTSDVQSVPASFSAETTARLEALGLTVTTSAQPGEMNYVTGEVVEPTYEILPQTVQSSDVINLTAFRNDPRFAGIDGQGYSVVVIDTGIDLNHPFFGPDLDSNGVADRIVFHYDFSGANDADASDFDGHGSNVTSIAASSDATYTGMAPGANIIALKVFPDGGGGASSVDIEEALQWVVDNQATYNIASVNLSLGAGNVQSYTTSSATDEFAALAAMGVLTAVSSGNDFFTVNSVQGVNYLSADPNVLSVGAVFDANIGTASYSGGATATTTDADRITPFTQRHETLLDILAPGAAITGANASGGFSAYHGTSQASPHIAGIAALMQQLAAQHIGRELTYVEMFDLMTETATTINDGDDEDDNVTNTNLDFPRIDVMAMAEAIWALGDQDPIPDANDQISEATPFVLGSTVTAGLDTTFLIEPADVDLYSFDVVAGQRVVFDIDINASSLNPVLRLFDSSGTELAFNDDNYTPNEAFSMESYIDYTFASGGTYYIGVSGAANTSYDPLTGEGDVPGSSEGAYRLFAESPDEDDQISEAIPLGTGSTAVGEIDPSLTTDSIDVDIYAVSVAANQTLAFDIDVNGSGLDSILRLFDSSGTGLATSNDDAAPGESASLESYIQYTFTVAGTYYIAVSGVPMYFFDPITGEDDTTGIYDDPQSSEGAYTLTVSGTSPLSNDPDDQIWEAIPVLVGSSTSGVVDTSDISDSGDVDMYSFTVEHGQRVGFDIDSDGSGLNSILRLFDQFGNQLTFSDNDSGPGESSSQDSYLEYTFAAGTYYIAVSGYQSLNYSPLTGLGDVLSSTGGYTLTLSEVSQGQTAFLADFTDEFGAASLDGFTIDGPPGLWHISTGRAFDPNHSSTHSMYYGQGEAFYGGGGDYNAGATSGSFTSPAIQLGMNSLLSFNYLLETEDFAGYDVASVLISTNGGGSFNPLPVSLTESNGRFLQGWVDLSPYDDEEVHIRFSFDTIDSFANEFEGWYVDDVHVITTFPNQVPTDVSLDNVTVEENQPVGTPVGVFSATDPDVGDTFTYTLVPGTGSEDNTSFSIAGDQLLTAESFDFETKDSYSIRVRVTDEGGLSFEKVFVINVLDANERPSGILLSATSIPENRPVGTTVGTLSAVDPDAGDTFTYSLVNGAGDDDNASFTISGNQLKTAEVFDADVKSSYKIRVRVTDAAGTKFEKVFTISVTSLNTRPTDLTLTPASVLENKSVGTVVGILAAVDPDVGDTFTYELVPGSGSDDNFRFTVDGNQLKTAEVFNHEQDSLHKVRLRVTDAAGTKLEKVFNISVLDANDRPTGITLSSNTVLRNQSIGTVIGNLSAVDADSSDSFTYELVSGAGSTHNANFSVIGNQLVTAAVFDGSRSIFYIRIRVTDEAGTKFEKMFQVKLTNTRPTSLSLSASTVAENAVIGTVVGLLSTNDPDLGDTFNYTLVSGAGAYDNDSFVIVGNELRTAEVFDFETKSSYSIRIQVADAAGAKFQAIFQITVTEETEVP